MPITDSNPKMQRRHFERIAKIINSLPDRKMNREEIAICFAACLAEMNNGFQREKFVNACMTGNMGKHRSRERAGA